MIEETLAQRPAIAVMAVLYMLLVCGIGVWAARRTRNERDFARVDGLDANAPRR